MPIPSFRTLGWTAITAAAVALVSLMLVVVQIDSAQDLILLRNALINDLGPSRAYDWTPDAVPANYILETLPTPQPLRDFVVKTSSRALAGDDLQVALTLADALIRNRVKGRGPIQSDTLTALERITKEGVGYCADYTQVFNALGRAADLTVREWGMSFEGYGGDGHAFSEVWDRQKQKWVFIDTFFSFYVRDDKGQPVSATEFREALLDGTASGLEIVPINRDKFGFKYPEKAIEYYRKGAPRFFMIWGNNVLSYDESRAVKVFSKVSKSAEQAAAIVTGVQPRLLIPLDLVDDRALKELSRLRALMVLFVMGACGACTAVALMWIRRRQRCQAAGTSL